MTRLSRYELSPEKLQALEAARRQSAPRPTASPARTSPRLRASAPPRLGPRPKVGSHFQPVMAELERRCPEHVDTNAWQQAIADGRTFLRTWGAQAHALGWTARDLFGLAPVPEGPAWNYRRLSRYDLTGLIWLLHGDPVVALTADTAAIRSHTSSITSYRKLNKPRYGPAGEQPPWRSNTAENLGSA
jgi:hypothetical protein